MRPKSDIELRHLRTFLVVAETQNFTRAGERLGLSQPSVSQQVKELEQALSTELFVRLGPRVRLTPSGRAFQSRTELVLAKLTEACQSLEDLGHLESGHLHVGVVPPLTVSWVPPVLSHFAKHHPQLSVSVHEKSSSDVEVDVESGRFDLGIGILSRASPNLSYELLRRDEVVLLAPVDSELADLGSVQREQLARTRLVLLPESFLIRQIIQDAFRRAQVLPRIAYEVSSIDGVLSTAAQTGLPTVMPRVVLEGRAHLNLVPVPLEGLHAELEFGLMWAGSGTPSPAAAAFASQLRERVTSQRTTGP